MADEPGYRTTRWSKHFEEIDQEIAKYALLCKVRLLDTGVLKRVLNDDATVCGATNPAMFRKLRNLLMMHYSVREKAVVALGPEETLRIVDDIVVRLRERFGSSLGTPEA
jgi:hypothetical protein